MALRSWALGAGVPSLRHVRTCADLPGHRNGAAARPWNVTPRLLTVTGNGAVGCRQPKDPSYRLEGEESESSTLAFSCALSRRVHTGTRGWRAGQGEENW